MTWPTLPTGTINVAASTTVNAMFSRCLVGHFADLQHALTGDAEFVLHVARGIAGDIQVIPMRLIGMHSHYVGMT